MAEEQYFDKLALMVKDEDDYGVSAGPTSTANAILAQNVRIKPMAAERSSGNSTATSGGRPELRTGKHVTFDYEIEAAGSGTPGTAPAYSPILRMVAMAEVLVTGLATIAATAVPAAGATGRFTYAKTTKFSGSYRRVATLTCTTPAAAVSPPSRCRRRKRPATPPTTSPAW